MPGCWAAGSAAAADAGPALGGSLRINMIEAVLHDLLESIRLDLHERHRGLPQVAPPAPGPGEPLPEARRPVAQAPADWCPALRGDATRPSAAQTAVSSAVAP